MIDLLLSAPLNILVLAQMKKNEIFLLKVYSYGICNLLFL